MAADPGWTKNGAWAASGNAASGGTAIHLARPEHTHRRAYPRAIQIFNTDATYDFTWSPDGGTTKFPLAAGASSPKLELNHGREWVEIAIYHATQTPEALVLCLE